MKQRGVEYILIACIDGLKGFPEAIEAIFPKTKVQLCIVHQIRSSMRYVTEKDKKAAIEDLKPVYKAVNEEMGYQNLLAFGEKWGKKYPIAAKSWLDNWSISLLFSNTMNKCVRPFILLIQLKECTGRYVKLRIPKVHSALSKLS